MAKVDTGATVSAMIFTRFCEMSGAHPTAEASFGDVATAPPALPPEWKSEMCTLLETAFAAQAAQLRRDLREELCSMLDGAGAGHRQRVRSDTGDLSADAEGECGLAPCRPRPMRRLHSPPAAPPPMLSQDSVTATPPPPRRPRGVRRSGDADVFASEELMMSGATPSEVSLSPRRNRRARTEGYFGQLLESATAEDAMSDATRDAVPAPDKIWQSTHRKAFLAAKSAARSKEELTRIGTPKPARSGSRDIASASSRSPDQTRKAGSAAERPPSPTRQKSAAPPAPPPALELPPAASNFTTEETVPVGRTPTVAGPAVPNFTTEETVPVGRTPTAAKDRRASMSSMILTDTPRSPRQQLFMPLPSRQVSKTTTLPTEGGDAQRARWPEHVRASAQALVENEFFGYFVAAAIFANAILMGVEAQLAAANARQIVLEESVSIQIASSVFCVCFAAELLLRVYVYRVSFFTMDGWLWNLFDLAVVGMHVSEEIVSFAAIEGQQRGGFATSFMRILRILRIVRMIRMVRLLRLVRELRTLVQSIGSTLASLFWTLLLLLLLIYIVAICFTQLVADSGRGDPDGVGDGTAAFKFFGSLDRAILVLFQCMTGGVNWQDVLDVLAERTSPLVALPFCLYIAFTVLAMLNVITGVFVESAIASTRAENSLDLLNSLREVVERMKDVGSNTLSWENFQNELNNPRMLSYFKSIDLDPSEAEGLFRLLDPDETGQIDVEDFIMGCLRLHGAAKAIDLTTLMCEVRWLRRRWHEHAYFIEQEIAGLQGYYPPISMSPKPSEGWMQAAPTQGSEAFAPLRSRRPPMPLLTLL